METKDNKPEKKTRRKKSACLDCQEKFFAENMAEGKRVCKPCQRDRMAASRTKTSEADSLELDMGSLKALHVDSEDSFENRDALSQCLKQNLQQAINDANQQIAYQKHRLEVATATGKGRLINEASKALQAAQTKHFELTAKLMERLKALDDLRAQSEKARPVTFFLITDPGQPLINPMREVPREFYPADRQAGESDGTD